MKNSQEEENISEILDAVQKIASGDFSARVPISGQDDAYNAIANGINMLAEEVEVYSNEKEDQSEALLNMLEDINVVKETVREERDRAQKYLDIAGVIIVAMSTTGEVTLINRKGCEILGYDEEEIIGKNWFDNFQPERFNTTVKPGSDKFLSQESKSPEYFENPVLTKSGEERIIAWHNSFVRDENGKLMGHLSSGEDITERKRAEEELIQSEKLAGIGTLASGIAHEVNNPLAGIMGYAEIMQDEEDLGKIREYTQKILKNTKRASDIVMWLSRYSREAKDTNIKSVDLQEVMDDAMEALTHTRRSSDVEVIKDFQKIPAIKGNRSELLQIFVNLMNNAVDAMPRGGKLNLSSAMENRYVAVKLSDSGVGIPKNQIKKIFDPFFTTKEVGKGTGLGLYVINMLVKKHHGAIDVESEVGKGTTFSLRFPVSEVSN